MSGLTLNYLSQVDKSEYQDSTKFMCTCCLPFVRQSQTVSSGSPRAISGVKTMLFCSCLARCRHGKLPFKL